MKSTRVFICALIFLTCGQSAAAESKLDQFEQDIDNEIVSVLGENNKTHALIVVAKKYLSRRKAAVNPKRSKYEEYEIVEAGGARRVSLLTVPVSEGLIVGKSSRVGDGFVVPVVRNSKIVEAYIYRPSTGLVEKMGTKIDIKGGNVLAVFAVSRGFVVILPSGPGVLAVYYSNESKTQSVMPLLAKKEVVLSVSDVIEQNGVVYITGVGAGVINAGNTYMWGYSFSSDDQQGDGKSFVFKDSSERMRPVFIPSLHSTPSILLAQSNSGSTPPVLNIISFDEKQHNIWSKNTSDMLGDKSFIAAGVCETNFLILETNKNEPSQQFLDFSLINRDGEETSIKFDSERNKDSYLKVMAHPVDNELYVVINYSRFEAVRRATGWYSWFGYRIDKYSLDSICKTKNGVSASL